MKRSANLCALEKHRKCLEALRFGQRPNPYQPFLKELCGKKTFAKLCLCREILVN
jgi:hypothetical protein